MRLSHRRFVLGGTLVLGMVLVASVPWILQEAFRRDLTRIAQPEAVPTPLPGQSWMSPVPTSIDGRYTDSFPIAAIGKARNPRERSRNVFVPENAVSPDKRGYLLFEFSESRSLVSRKILHRWHLIPLEAGAPTHTWSPSYRYGLIEPVCAWLPDSSGFLELFETDTMFRDIRLHRFTNPKETSSLSLTTSRFPSTPRFLSPSRVIVPMAGPTSGSGGRATSVCEDEFEITGEGLKKVRHSEQRLLPFFASISAADLSPDGKRYVLAVRPEFGADRPAFIDWLLSLVGRNGPQNRQEDRGEFWVVGRNGENPRLLGTFERSARWQALAWTPDSTAVRFRMDGKAYRLPLP